MAALMRLVELLKELDHLDARSSIDDEDLFQEEEAEGCLFVLWSQHVMLNVVLEYILHDATTLPVEL